MLSRRLENFFIRDNCVSFPPRFRFWVGGLVFFFCFLLRGVDIICILICRFWGA